VQPDSKYVTVSRTKKWLGSILVIVACGTLLWTTGAQAFGQSGSPGFQQGSFELRFTDRTGKPRATPVITVPNGYPGMPAVASSLSIGNMGSLPASYTLGVVGLPDSRRSLADVLVVRVEDASGSVVYQGSLKALSLQGPEPLAAGDLATYSIEVTWPGSADGNRYQGQQLSIDLRLSSQAAEGSD
jgi:hypothetical protein